jgi:REP element-mobilizing transposase RayT
MARKPRFPVAGLPMHVIQRGNNRQVCFNDSSDRRRYLADLGESLRRYEVALHAWVLMSNHVHLLVTPRPNFLALDEDSRHRRSAYRQLFSEPLGDAALSAIRNAANSELVLGSERFKDHIEADTARPARSRSRGRPPAAKKSSDPKEKIRL